MKKIIFTLLVISTSLWSRAQIISSTPQFITQSNAGSIELIYDATLGTAGLKDYAGTDVYAHTGVITTASSSGSDWKHAPTWLDNSAKYKLLPLGNNKWKFIITPSLSTFYGLSVGEQVTKLVFVFRNGTGTKEGKDSGGNDIFVNVFQDGLNVAFSNPTSNQLIAEGTVMSINANASITSTIKLLVNGIVVKNEEAAVSLTHSYTFTSVGDYTLIAEATAAGETVRDTAYICVPANVSTQARPEGLMDGINYGSDNTSATLILYAPSKSNVFLLGEFNNWTQLNAYQLKKDGDYWWITLTDLIPGQLYGFQYLVDGVVRISDAYTEMVLDPWDDKWINQKYSIYPNLKAYPTGKTEGLVATLQTAKPSYKWEIPNFTISTPENLVIYELLLRDFTVEKSLDAAILKLDYLKNLGITAVELMPIQEFDGNNSWGYNPNHYFATDKAYGTTETYKKFIDECHKRGIAVILDVVLNHATGSNPFAKLYWDNANNRPATNNPWMNITATHPYSVFNDFNHSFNGTKEFFKRMIKYWITEYNIDGYRLDLTKGLTQTQSTDSTASNYDQSRIDNISVYYDAAKSVKADVIFILEHFCNDAEETVLANKGMYLWRNVNNEYSQSAMGYSSYSDFGRMNPSLRRWVGYAESHDEERNFFKAKMYGAGNLKTDSIARINRVPLNIAFATLIPGPKMIWQFGEFGYDYSIDSNGGRTNEKPSAWGWLNLAHRKAAADASAEIIQLRKTYPNAFASGNFTLNVGTSDWTTGRRIALTHTDLNMVVLGNFQATGNISSNPNFQKTGIWYNLLTGEELNVTNTQMNIEMQPGELLIYTDRKSNDTVFSQPNCSVFPSITNTKVFISTSSINTVNVYNLQGMIVKSVSNVSEIDFSRFNNGLYLLEVNALNGKYKYKIIKN